MLVKTGMESSLEPVQFLANSPNRVRVLTALMDGESTRRGLQEAVDGSRSTVARILDEGQDRNWVASEGTRYRLTPLGEAMVTNFRSYLDTVTVLRDLGDTINDFPPPLRSLDPTHLQDAEIIESSTEDPAAPVSAGFDRFKRASVYRSVTHTAIPHFVASLREGLEQGRLDMEVVIEEGFIETIDDDPTRLANWERLSEQTRVYDGVIPISLHIIDETVLVWLGETRGEAVGLFISENPDVLSWAEALYESYRSESEPYDDH